MTSGGNRKPPNAGRRVTAGLGRRTHLTRRSLPDERAFNECNRPVSDQVRLMAHVSRWLARQSLGVGDLTPDLVEEFLVARRNAGYALWLSSKGVAPLLGHLRRLAVVPVPEAAVATTPAEHLLESYRAYLIEERGLAAATVVLVRAAPIDVRVVARAETEPDNPGGHVTRLGVMVANCIAPDDLEGRFKEVHFRFPGCARNGFQYSTSSFSHFSSSASVPLSRTRPYSSL